MVQPLNIWWDTAGYIIFIIITSVRGSKLHQRCSEARPRVAKLCPGPGAHEAPKRTPAKSPPKASSPTKLLWPLKKTWPETSRNPKTHPVLVNLGIVHMAGKKEAKRVSPYLQTIDNLRKKNMAPICHRVDLSISTALSAQHLGIRLHIFSPNLSMILGFF